MFDLKHRLRRLYLNVGKPVAISLWRNRLSVNKKQFWEAWWHDSTTTDGGSIQRSETARDKVQTTHHYAIVEAALTALVVRHKIRVDGATVLDVGSGAGHWLDFWEQHTADNLHAVEVADRAINHLRETYPGVTVHQSDIANFEGTVDADIISAVGVMFHLVDDEEWHNGIQTIADLLSPGGVVFFTGAMGWFSHDVEFEQTGGGLFPFKRVRSRWVWRRACQKAGLELVTIYRTPAAIQCETPQNDVLMARKPPQ